MVSRKPVLIRASVLNRDANGLFFNTPSLGAELYADTGFDNSASWTKGGGWTVTGSKGTGTATNASITQNVATINRYGRLSYDLVTVVGGSTNSGGLAAQAQSTPGTYVSESLATSATPGITGTGFTGTVDNASMKHYTHGECFVLCDGFTPYRGMIMYTPNAASWSRLNAIALCDRLASPLSYLEVVYTITSAGVTALALTKFVNDVRSTVVGTTSVTFVANAPIELRRLLGTNTFQLWYNNIQVGTDQAVSDAAIINNTLYGFVGLSAQGLITDLQLDGMSIF